MLSVAEAWARIRAELRPLPIERVSVSDADGRVLAEPVVSGRDLPPCDNSAMDGFAVRAADVPGTLSVRGVSAAGDAPDSELAAGAAMRIMTGAPVPRGADAVVMREDADDQGERVAFAETARPGQHIRRAGEDVAHGRRVLEPGAALGPGEIGLLAALGVADVPVFRRPRVAILSTGDELVDVDVEPGPGQIVNSNAYALAAAVREAGGVPVPAGIARDQLDDAVARIEQALDADVLVSSGGVSVGDYDVVKEAFERCGVELGFWKVAMKPGKPLAFGVKDGTPVFGLPGNPVSSMVVFELFGRPALRVLQGAREQDVLRPRVPVTLAVDHPKKPGRAHFVRVRIERDGAELRALPTGDQGSGRTMSMVGVDALVEVPADSGPVAAGTPLTAWLLRAV